MSFCRECGKEVEHDWVTCPYCSQTIGPPNLNSQKVQDSVIMGDVNTNINDSASISAAMKESLECPDCHSTGAILMGCVNCGEHAGCSLCIDTIASNRRFSMSKHSEDIDWYFDYERENGDVSLTLYKGTCQSCYDKKHQKYLAFQIESCSELKQDIISTRKKVLSLRFHITKKDIEASTMISRSIESPTYERSTEKIWMYLDYVVGVYSKNNRYCLDKRRDLKKDFGYTDEYITENLQLLTATDDGRERAMTDFEWSSYLSTLIPRQGYAGYKKVETLPKKRRKAVRRKKE